jgi:hypothetical protein
VYPNSFWLPGTGVQRGTLSLSDGDPLTPNWPSVDNAYRLDMEERQVERPINCPIPENNTHNIVIYHVHVCQEQCEQGVTDILLARRRFKRDCIMRFFTSGFSFVNPVFLLLSLTFTTIFIQYFKATVRRDLRGVKSGIH